MERSSQNNLELELIKNFDFIANQNILRLTNLFLVLTQNEDKPATNLDIADSPNFNYEAINSILDLNIGVNERNKTKANNTVFKMLENTDIFDLAIEFKSINKIPEVIKNLERHLVIHIGNIKFGYENYGDLHDFFKDFLLLCACCELNPQLANILDKELACILAFLNQILIIKDYKGHFNPLPVYKKYLLSSRSFSSDFNCLPNLNILTQKLVLQCQLNGSVEIENYRKRHDFFDQKGNQNLSYPIEFQKAANKLDEVIFS
jgi:hypothetical protein